ncbi:hypothetical protein F2P81_017608 [Scophthalmus maximus]|uniref:Uncharacterized protein n=1 Tax=Scophthalmus maximus TaxID=52904 RepID=A0A6A4SCE1_SCOMX|nr:hypothetical protein F2P81_017608 [Scophthalmus maximus]
MSVTADDVEQLVTHLVTALTELHRHHRHIPAPGRESGHGSPVRGGQQAPLRSHRQRHLSCRRLVVFRTSDVLPPPADRPELPVVTVNVTVKIKCLIHTSSEPSE